ncbi:PD-(D/E)XK nuclease family protein [Chryseolinea sp. T2]|uniref:PD-(D/E)XK nuclease family protein n=1 Tax=Chryseolinea sp. T2 TaxID=3129255 RepID=UPI003077DA43
MQTFLQEIATDIVRQYKQLDKLTIVFPNRRAVIYFRKHLAAHFSKPTFAPKMITIEDFFSEYSPWKVPDKLLLIQRLYDAYHEAVDHSGREREAFDKFYFWGDMLLRDFEEIDKYLIPAEQLFTNLSVQKELDATFDFLTDEQREFLQSFWKGFENNVSANKQKFLSVWNGLLDLYTLFHERLSAEGLAYEGMLQRSVVENLAALTSSEDRQIVFAGFNALTKAEEALMTTFVEQYNAVVYWDMDAYYVNNNVQEAGRFFREYQKHDILGKTFTQHVPSNLLSKKLKQVADNNTTDELHPDSSIKIFGAPDPVSQAKLMSQILRDQLTLGLNPEETLIVLPDEKLLLPVLHGLSSAVEKLNVTMGFPLSATPMFALAELLIELQISRRHDHFNHRQVLALLGHPYVVAADFASANEKRKEILKHNWVHIPKSFLATAVDIHREIFIPIEPADVVGYLRNITTAVGAIASINDLDKEYAFHFLMLLNRMEEIVGDALPKATAPDSRGGTTRRQSAFKSFLRLLRQLIQAQKIPFSGEPLRGLQVMGMLETRNLDFKNVFMLSLNEGSLPASAQKGSYIPFNIRKAYGLPTVEHQDAIYSYLFYRVLQRADNIYLFYNSETDVLGQGEMSRYLQQIIYESGIPMSRAVLHNSIRPSPINPITIQKSPAIRETLLKMNEGNEYSQGISPSALNTYIECRLRFYLRYVARVREADEVEEDLDARILGNFLHEVMEHLYNEIVEQKGNRIVQREDIEKAHGRIDKLIDAVFIRAYRLDPEQRVDYAGQRIVVREVVRSFVGRILLNDKAYSPFILEATEQGGFLYRVELSGTNTTVKVSGKIDRIDRKDNVVRIIDYKTGKDQLDFDSVESLFSRDARRNKAAFQTLLYALLYHTNKPGTERLLAGLINRINLFDRNFQFGFRMGKDYVEDARDLFPEFKARLAETLHELYVSDTPFDQTTNTDTCKFCEFNELCYR